MNVRFCNDKSLTMKVNFGWGKELTNTSTVLSKDALRVPQVLNSISDCSPMLAVSCEVQQQYLHSIITTYFMFTLLFNTKL